MYGSTPAPPTPPERTCLPGLDVLTSAAILCAWTGLVVQQMLFKDAVSVTRYGLKEVVLCHYPLFLTGTINGIASAVCFACVFVMRRATRCAGTSSEPSADKSSPDDAWTDRPFTWPQLLMLLLTGLLEGFERGFQNKAFQYLGIATRTMLCSTGILFTMAVARALGLETIRWLKLLAAGVLVVGGCMQGLGMTRGETPITGIVCVFISVVAGACRWATLQCIAHKTPIKMNIATNLKMIAFMKPMDCLFCYLLSWLWERADFTAVTGDLVLMWFVLAGLIVGIVVCDIMIVSRTSAVALGVVMVLAQIPMVAAGVVLNKESVTAWQLIGFAVCVVGAFVYFRARALEGAAAPAQAALNGKLEA